MYKNYYDKRRSTTTKKQLQVFGRFIIWLDKNNPVILDYKCFELYRVKYVTQRKEHWTTQSILGILLWSSLLNCQGLQTNTIFFL